MSKKVMRLLDPHTGRMECKVCGAEHYANLKPGGGGTFYRGSWQCQHGCKLAAGPDTSKKRPDIYLDSLVAANQRNLVAAVLCEDSDPRESRDRYNEACAISRAIDDYIASRGKDSVDRKS